MSTLHRLRVAVAGGLLMLVTAGCGGHATPPAQAVPKLRAGLSAVDSAIVDHRYRQARHQLHQLVNAVQGAREAGDLASAQAERILSAATGLLSALPEPTPSPEPSPQPKRDNEPPTSDESNHDQRPEEANKDQEKRREELRKRREELAKQRKEEKKKDEDDHGDDDGGGEGEDSDENDSDGKYGGHGN